MPAADDVNDSTNSITDAAAAANSGSRRVGEYGFTDVDSFR
jgi:hypothetical protein